MALSFSEKRFFGLIFLPVSLNSHPMTAMFDTGAGMTIMPTRTAAAIGLEWDGGVRHGGNNQNQPLTLETGRVKHLQLETVTLTGQTVGVLPDSAFDVGQDDRGNPFPADLFLGWDVISQLCWDFDMERRQVSIAPGGTMAPSDVLSWDRFPFLRVRYHGAEVPLGLDSGHTETMLDNSWQQRLGDLRPATTRTVGVGSAMEEPVLLAPALELGIAGTRICLHDTEVLNRPIPGVKPGTLTGLLGVDILQGRRWIIDPMSHDFRLL